MPKFSANLNFLYGNLPFLEQFPAAAADGFKAVEFVSPYGCEPAALRKVLDDNKLIASLFNAPAGDWGKGERGLTVLEERDREYRDSVDTIIKYANVLGTKCVNVMAGINSKEESKAKMFDRLVERLRFAADVFAKHNIVLLLEHINNFDIPGYCVGTPAEALEVISRVDRKNAKIQYDIYHAQRTSGELTKFLRDNFARIGHIQVADNPGRNQPGTGEMNYKFLLDELDRLGYQGWVGLEYKPLPNAGGSLGWIKAMGYSL